MATSNHTIRVGLTVGFIAFISVAAFYAVFDLLAARGALYTVDLLGKSVFRGFDDPSVLGLPIQLDWAVIGWYSGLHLALSLIIGLIVTGLVDYSNRGPSQARMVALTIVAGFVVTILAVGLLTGSFRELLPFWSIVVANALAVFFAGVYLVKKCPGAWSRLGSSNTPKVIL